MRISYTGDDGCTERLAVLSTNSDSSAVEIAGISADTSCRSFLIKLPVGRVSYFWCSEKSKLLGDEMLNKMKDLLKRKPSLAQFTGISEHRLDCFATHLRAYLLGSASAKQSSSTSGSTSLLATVSESLQLDPNNQSLFASSKTLRSQPTASQLTKSHSSLYLGSLSPRSNNFKDGVPRNSFSIRGSGREKFRQHVDSSCSFAAIEVQRITSSPNSSTTKISSCQTEDDKIPEEGKCSKFRPSDVSEIIDPCNHAASFIPLPLGHPLSQVTAANSSVFSPYYCWCPPSTSTLQYTVTPPYLPSTSTETISLPPLSSLLSVARSSSSLVPPKAPLDISEIPPLDFPAFLPDPLVRIPIPVSSLITVPSSQQIPTFTPFMSDPIVHIPVLDVCSSGQGYLVSAGPSISTTISPLLPNHLVNPLIAETESVVEKSARETLRLLIGSTQTSTPLMEMLPAILTGVDNSLPRVHGMKHGPLVQGSRGLYSGTADVDAVASSASCGLLTLLGSAEGGDGNNSDRTRRHSIFESEDQQNNSSSGGLDEGSKAD